MIWTQELKLNVYRGVRGNAKAEISSREDCWRVFVDTRMTYSYASVAARFNKDATLADVKKWAQDWVECQEELLLRAE